MGACAMCRILSPGLLRCRLRSSGHIRRGCSPPVLADASPSGCLDRDNRSTYSFASPKDKRKRRGRRLRLRQREIDATEGALETERVIEAGELDLLFQEIAAVMNLDRLGLAVSAA